MKKSKTDKAGLNTAVKQSKKVVSPEGTETADPKSANRGRGKISKEKATKQDLVVFAFRLTEAERDLIHKAAGPAKASKYVRSLAVAAARGDEGAVKNILKDPKAAGV